jgi:hypothetical protein
LTGHENLNELPPLLFLKASRGQKAKTTFRTDFVFPPFALFLLGLQFIKFKKNSSRADRLEKATVCHADESRLVC